MNLSIVLFFSKKAEASKFFNLLNFLKSVFIIILFGLLHPHDLFIYNWKFYLLTPFAHFAPPPPALSEKDLGS